MSNENYLTIEEIVSRPVFTGVTVSDDGKKTAFVKRTADWDENAYRKHIWVYEKESKRCYPISSGKDETFSAVWSPDSQMLAYVHLVGEDDNKKNQIFVKLSLDEPGIQISYAEEGVNKFVWSPDGKGFYYLTKRPKTEGMKKRKEIYGDFEYIDKKERCNCLYYVKLSKGLEISTETYFGPKDLRQKETDSKDDKNKKKEEIAIQLTDGKDFHIYNFVITPDSKYVIFNSALTPNMEDMDDLTLYLLELSSKKLKKLSNAKNISHGLVISPDGSKVCYTRYDEAGKWFLNLKLELMEIETEEIRLLDVDFQENLIPIRWTERGIMVQWQDRTSMNIGLLDENGQIEPLIAGDDCFVFGSSITKDGQHLAYKKATSERPFEVYLDEEKITDQYKLFVDKKLSKKQVIRWNSFDGTEIEGILSTPKYFDPTKKYPLLLVVHGGPTFASFAIPTDSRYYPMEQFVEKGFIVLQPNYRGSSGYGEKFRKLNYRNLGLGDYEDVISGVDFLVKEGFVDEEKVGVMGWSQGGYISAFCSTYSDRFKAISVGAGISNWVTYYVNTDIHQFTRLYLNDNPWNDPEIYQKTSPMTYIKSACTPTLIQHGDSDQRVPVPNAFELYQGLRDMNVETELVIFKGMGHNSTKPGIHRAILKQNLIWFSHHILGESMDGFYLGVDQDD
ncbi:MAG: S9 family peptidase [Halanaerobiales bacterium]|nr:S9 family peptidase [Halanaerobiales bacterium]